MDEEEHFLNDTWSLYFHHPYNASWTYDSYDMLHLVSSIEDFWKTHSAVKPYVQDYMFFLMRESVFPCWDDQHNINGGCISMKVAKGDVNAFWEELCIRALGETLACDDSAPSIVNGISISPKRYYCIVKIWLAVDITDKIGGDSSSSASYKTISSMFAIPKQYNGEMLYRCNIDMIRGSGGDVVRTRGPRTAAPGTA